jgi:hypothetical protein
MGYWKQQGEQNIKQEATGQGSFFDFIRFAGSVS